MKKDAMLFVWVCFLVALGLQTGFAGNVNRGQGFRNDLGALAEGGFNVNTRGPHSNTKSIAFTGTSSPGLFIPDISTVSNSITFFPPPLSGDRNAALGVIPVKKVTVQVNITHASIGDLTIKLTHGDATGTLMGHRGGGSRNLSVTFDDDSFVPISLAPIFSAVGANGTFRPEIPLSIFAVPRGFSGTSTIAPTKNTDVRGPWTLTVNDDIPGGSGSLDSWTLKIISSDDFFSDSSGGLLLPRKFTQGFFGSLFTSNVVSRARSQP